MRAPDGYTLATAEQVARFVAASPDRTGTESDVTGLVEAGEVVCAIPASWSHALFAKGGERVLRRGVAALFAALAANPHDVTIAQPAIGAAGRDDARLAILDRLFTQHAPPGAVKSRFARIDGARWVEIAPRVAGSAAGGNLVRLPNVTLAANPPRKAPSWIARVTAR